MSRPAVVEPVDPAREYYEAAFKKRQPLWVPATVMVLREVRPDLPFFSAGCIKPGPTAVECNQWGAVAARDSKGQLLGLKPDEFDVLTWRAAQGQGDGRG